MLTREQIQKMTDSAVNLYLAEKVMGWQWKRLDYPAQPQEGWYVDGRRDHLVGDYDPVCNLNQALDAAEKVANGQFIRIESQVRLAENRFSQRGWVCMIGNMAQGVGYAITPALAFCRAAIYFRESSTT